MKTYSDQEIRDFIKYWGDRGDGRGMEPEYETSVPMLEQLLKQVALFRAKIAEQEETIEELGYDMQNLHEMQDMDE